MIDLIHSFYRVPGHPEAAGFAEGVITRGKRKYGTTREAAPLRFER